MARKDSPRTEPQSRRDRWDEAGDPRQPPKPTNEGRAPSEPVADTDGQSGYAAGGGLLRGSGAWSGRANPENGSAGSGPVPNEGALRPEAETVGAPKKVTTKKRTTKKTSTKSTTTEKTTTKKKATKQTATKRAR